MDRHTAKPIAHKTKTKDLRKLYTQREIKNSKYLVLAQEINDNNRGQPLILRGAFTKDEIMSRTGVDSLAVLAYRNQTGSFEDPETGNTEYDRKLAEVEEQESRDELESRKGHRPSLHG